MGFDGRLLGGVGVMAAVVETGNFARAGDALGLTQSGVSRAIARLEVRVGVRLFDRTPRAVTLTDEGRRFHQSVVPLLIGLEEAATDAAGSAAVVRGRLRINVDPFFARLVLAPRLGKFLAAYPELSVEIVGRDRLGDLVADGFDAAVRFGEPEPSALIARRLLATRVLTCAAPSYLAKHGRPAHPRDLGAGSHECTCHRPAISLEISPRPAETSGRGFRPPDGEQRRHDVGCLRRRSWSGATSRARDRRSPRSRETHRAVPRFVGRAVSALRNPSFTTRAARKGARIPGFRSRLGSLTARFTRTKPGPCPLGA
jgi:DNA-binding transcriptional LysR family regulator